MIQYDQTKKHDKFQEVSHKALKYLQLIYKIETHEDYNLAHEEQIEQIVSSNFKQ